MKSIITLIIAIMSVSTSFANGNTIHKGNKMSFYKVEDTTIFNPASVLSNSDVSLEERIATDNQIIGAANGEELTASVKSAEEVIHDDQKIIEAVMPAAAPLNFKKINKKPTRFVKGTIILAKN